MLFYLDNLQIIGKCVSLHCVFHSIRFKVNKGWSKALLLFLCLYVSLPAQPFSKGKAVIHRLVLCHPVINNHSL